MNSQSILLIDDHAMYRASLQMVICMAIDHVTVLHAASIEDALRITSVSPDVLLLDIRLNGVSGLEALPDLQQRWPMAPVLVLSSQDEPETARFAVARGAAAFVSKAEPAERIVSVVKRALGGDFPLVRSGSDSCARKLTMSQREVLQLLHHGMSNKLIARKLGLSDNTVRRHVQDILEYFKVVTRAEAVFVARQQSLVG